MERNVVLNADDDGIEVGDQESTIEKNIIMQSGGRGIVLGGDGSHTAIYNRIRWTKGDRTELSHGLVVASSGNHVRENSVMNSGGHGVFIQDRSNQVFSNKVVGSGINGIMTTGGENLIATNIARKSLLFDLSDESDGSNTYRGNKFTKVDPEGNQP
jgi:hypothetical protein